jgi:hypothetical protein
MQTLNKASTSEAMNNLPMSGSMSDCAEGLCKKCDASGVQHSHEVLLQWPLRGHQETSTRTNLVALVD